MQNKKFFVALLAIIVLFLGVFTFAQTSGNNEEEIIDGGSIPKKEKIKEGAKENLEGQSGENNLDQPEENSQTLLTPNRVQIQVDVTAPIITIADYIKTPTNQTIVVTATTNEGTLNQTTYTFIENGSFTFIATDAAGNKSEKEIVINNIDKVAPKGTITYDNLELTNKDVVATLTIDEEATITNNEGSNTYTFTENGVFEFAFIDAAGNIGTATAEVKNIDKTAPEAPTLTSPLNEAIIKGDIITNSWSFVPDAIKYMYESYRNESATTLRHKQTIDAPNHSKTATNISNDTFWWRVKSVDQAGNESLWSDLWKVTVDNTKPIITLNGDSEIFVEFGTEYEELGAKVTDNVDEDLEAIITSDLDLTKLGTYTIKYNVPDTAGNIADEVTRTVNVVDSTEPIITLNGGDMEIVLGESFTDPGVASVSDNYATLSLENVIKTGSVNVNVEGTYELNYSITDGFNTTNVKRKVIVKPLIKQLSVYNPNEETKYNGFNISFNRDFVVNDPSQIKIQYEYSIEGGSYVLANLVKYPGYVSSNRTYLQEEYNFFEDIITQKTTTFYGMLNANGGKILYKKSLIGIESFKADTIQKDVVVSMQEHNVQDRLRTAYKAIQSGKTVSIRTILTFKLENGEKVTYKLDPIKYN